MAKYNIVEIKEKKADYRSLVSPRMMDKLRIDEAMSILVDKRYQYLTIEEVSDMVGFGNRQSFYASFFRLKGITPRQYRLDNLQKHPAMVARRK